MSDRLHTYIECETCHGKGRLKVMLCTACNGTGIRRCIE